MDVVGVWGRDDGDVVLRRWDRVASRVSWMIRKGRYLFASSEGWGVWSGGESGISVSDPLRLTEACGRGPFVEVDLNEAGGIG